MTYTAKIEQTHAYKKRMHYMPNTDTFEEKDCESLSYIRNVPFRAQVPRPSTQLWEWQESNCKYTPTLSADRFPPCTVSTWQTPCHSSGFSALLTSVTRLILHS